MAARYSYVFQILKFLGDGRARTSLEIWKFLHASRSEFEVSNEWPLRIPSRQNLEETLAELRNIGVLSSRETPGELPQWISMAARREGNGDDGGRSVSGPGDNTPEGGGGGLAEVIGHPVLLCLSEDDQYALLDAAFDIHPDRGVEGTND